MLWLVFEIFQCWLLILKLYIGYLFIWQHFDLQVIYAYLVIWFQYRRTHSNILSSLHARQKYIATFFPLDNWPLSFVCATLHILRTRHCFIVHFTVKSASPEHQHVSQVSPSVFSSCHLSLRVTFVLNCFAIYHVSKLGTLEPFISN